MIYELPDVDLESMSLDELKEHAKVCAQVECKMRDYVVSVHFKIIQRVNERNEAYDKATDQTITRAKKLTAKVRTANRTRTAADFLAIMDEDEPTIDDFK